MGRLVIKAAILVTILIIIKAPFFYAFKSDADQLKAGLEAREFNTVFLGSSRTRAAVIPPYFDSLTEGKSDSYNFGVLGGAWLPDIRPG